MNKFDRLYMYIGCDLQTPKGVGVFCGVSCVGEVYVKVDGRLACFTKEEVKPVLYDQHEVLLNAMQLKKFLKVQQAIHNGKVALSCTMDTEIFAVLIESHVDVFGWIAAGKAVRKPFKE